MLLYITSHLIFTMLPTITLFNTPLREFITLVTSATMMPLPKVNGKGSESTLIATFAHHLRLLAKHFPYTPLRMISRHVYTMSGVGHQVKEFDEGEWCDTGYEVDEWVARESMRAAIQFRKDDGTVVLPPITKYTTYHHTALQGVLDEKAAGDPILRRDPVVKAALRVLWGRCGGGTLLKAIREDEEENREMKVGDEMRGELELLVRREVLQRVLDKEKIGGRIWKGVWLYLRRSLVHVERCL